MQFFTFCSIVVSAACVVLQPAGAQQLTGAARWADSARVDLEAGYAAGEVARVAAARALVERALAAHPNDALLLHYQGYALYREATLRDALGGGQSGDKDRSRDVRPLFEEADRVLERSAAALPLPETYALRSTILGRLIGMSPLRAMELGPKASEMMDRALARGPDNPRVWLLRGINAMFTPRMWGGGLDKSERYLNKAAELYGRARPEPPAPAWGHAEAYVWLGQLRERQKNREAARNAYLKALELQPENQWVRHHLLPALERAPGTG